MSQSLSNNFGVDPFVQPGLRRAVAECMQVVFAADVGLRGQALDQLANAIIGQRMALYVEPITDSFVQRDLQKGAKSRNLAVWCAISMANQQSQFSAGRSILPKYGVDFKLQAQRRRRGLTGRMTGFLCHRFFVPHRITFHLSNTRVLHSNQLPNSQELAYHKQDYRLALTLAALCGKIGVEMSPSMSEGFGHF